MVSLGVIISKVLRQNAYMTNLVGQRRGLIFGLAENQPPSSSLKVVKVVILSSGLLGKQSFF